MAGCRVFDVTHRRTGRAEKFVKSDAVRPQRITPARQDEGGRKGDRVCRTARLPHEPLTQTDVTVRTPRAKTSAVDIDKERRIVRYALPEKGAEKPRIGTIFQLPHTPASSKNAFMRLSVPCDSGICGMDAHACSIPCPTSSRHFTPEETAFS